MKSRCPLGSVMLAGLVGLLVPVGYVQAVPTETVQSCSAGGWLLCKSGKCGTNYCVCNGKTLAPGEDCRKKVGGKTFYFYCDGCSGKVVPLITSAQAGGTTPSVQRRGVEGEEPGASAQPDKGTAK